MFKQKFYLDKLNERRQAKILKGYLNMKIIYIHTKLMDFDEPTVGGAVKAVL